MSESFADDFFDGFCSVLGTSMGIIGIIISSLQTSKDPIVVISALVFWTLVFLVSLIFTIRTTYFYLQSKKEKKKKVTKTEKSVRTKN